MSKEFWNNRYKTKDYAYGKEPNLFFKTAIQNFKTGSILLPLEGEGRNAHHAAKLGWEVTGFDSSIEGQKKALQLCKKSNVSIKYDIADIEEVSYPTESFDAIGLIFAHFPLLKRRAFHQKITAYLKPGGLLFLEGYSKEHYAFNSLDSKVGGPDNPEMLFSKEDLLVDFSNFEILKLEKKEIVLNEGLYHNGKSAVIRMIAKKK